MTFPFYSRRRASILSLLCASILPISAHAAGISGDRLATLAPSGIVEMERFPSVSSGRPPLCEIQLSYEWSEPLSNQALVSGGDYVDASWSDGGPDYNSSQGTSSVVNTAYFRYKRTERNSGEYTGGPAHRYTMFIAIAQRGPFRLGQEFVFEPDADNPGSATSTVRVTLTGDEIYGEADGYGTNWSTYCVN